MDLTFANNRALSFGCWHKPDPYIFLWAETDRDPDGFSRVRTSDLASDPGSICYIYKSGVQCEFRTPLWFSIFGVRFRRTKPGLPILSFTQVGGGCGAARPLPHQLRGHRRVRIRLLGVAHAHVRVCGRGLPLARMCPPTHLPRVCPVASQILPRAACHQPRGRRSAHGPAQACAPGPSFPPAAPLVPA